MMQVQPMTLPSLPFLAEMFAGEPAPGDGGRVKNRPASKKTSKKKTPKKKK